jgi:hypothetical protein
LTPSAPRGRGRRAAALGAVAAALLLSAAASVNGERVQRGSLVVSLDGGISPRRLPRDRPAPVTLSLSGELRTVDGSELPRLRSVEFELAGSGALDTRGLGSCPRRQLVNALPPAALAACSSSLVGRGHLNVAVFLPGQAPFRVHATLRAFNGRLSSGRRVVWVHVYSADPPAVFILPFAVHRHSGRSFGFSLLSRIPAGLSPWPHLARFEMSFGRTWRWHGARHSYVSGSCPLPPRFTAGVFPFARATYRFTAARKISTEIVRGCQARS